MCLRLGSGLVGVLKVLVLVIQPVVIMLFPRVEEDVVQEVPLLFEGLQVLVSPGEPPVVVERLVQEQVILLIALVVRPRLEKKSSKSKWKKSSSGCSSWRWWKSSSSCRKASWPRESYVLLESWLDRTS